MTPRFPRNCPSKLRCLAILLATISTGCALSPRRQVRPQVSHQPVRAHLLFATGETLEMTVSAVEPDYLVGWVQGREGEAEFDVTRAQSASTVTISPSGDVIAVGRTFNADDLARGVINLGDESVRFQTTAGVVVFRRITGVTEPWVRGDLGNTDGPVRVRRRLIRPTGGFPASPVVSARRDSRTRVLLTSAILLLGHLSR
jgi:hypothetical protein